MINKTPQNIRILRSFYYTMQYKEINDETIAKNLSN
jgi:hypothetical protein